MKLYKPSYSYETNQKSFSKYEHEQHMSQSEYAKYAGDNKPILSSYDSQAQDKFLGRSIGFDANESSHAKGNKSTNYYAHAQSALPSPALHVQEGHHCVMKNMKRHESHVGQEWASSSPKCPNPALVDQSGLTMQNDKHMMGEMEHAWSNKPNQYSSPAQYHQGQSIYKDGDQKAYNYSGGGYEGGYASKSTALSSPKYLSPIKTNQSGRMAHTDEHIMGNMDQGWAKSTSKYSSPTQAEHSGLAMRNDDYMMGKTDNGWANSPTKFSTQSHQSGLAMHKKEHMMENNDQGWAYSPNKYSGSNHIQHVDRSMSIHSEKYMPGDMDHGWSNSPSKYSSPNPTHHSGLAMHEQDHMTRNVDHGWSSSPIRYSSPTQPQHSGLAIHEQDHMTGNVSRGWSNSPNKFSSPTQAHHSSRALHKEEHSMGETNRGWANSPTQYSGPNHFSNAIYGDREQHGWGGKSSNGFGANQGNYSAHASYDDYDQTVDEGVHDIMDEILTKYPAHNVSGGHGSSWATKPNTSYANQNQAMGYSKQKSFGGSAQYGSAAQSMASSSSKFAMNKEMNIGFSTNCNKEEYSANSSAKKFVAKIMINRRG